MSQPTQQPSSGAVKSDGRDSRLSFRNFAETQLRKDFKAEAIEKCNLQVAAFATCIQEKGLWAPFQCRGYQKDVHDCMAVYNSEERFELFKKEHEDEINAKPYVQASSSAAPR